MLLYQNLINTFVSKYVRDYFVTFEKTIENELHCTGK